MSWRKFVFVPLFLFVFFAGAKAQELPSRYTRYAQALQLLDSLRNAYPEICRLDTMGYSSRDSVPMLRFKISDNPNIDEDEPAVFFCGGVHADEVLGPEVVLWFIKDILRRYSNHDSVAVYDINNLEIYCIPFINPEGHIVVENGDTDWRKNKYDNNHDGIFNFHDGVDNNRNYDFAWTLDTTRSGNVPESVEYKGTAPFTQNENIAMRDFAWKYRPLVAVDYHSPTYGRAEKVYYNWYWYPPTGHGMAPDEALMLNIGQQYASRIRRDVGDSTYEARRGLVDKGDFKTYFYANFGTASFAVEISDTTIQNPALVDSICAHHLPGQYYLRNRALGPGVTGVIRDSVTLEPIEAEVQVQNYTSPDINPRLSRPDNGRYRRVLGNGTYSLTFLKSGYRSRAVSNVVVRTTGGPTVVDKLLPPINPRPPAPVLIYPPPDTTLNDDSSGPTFIWRSSPFATKYRFEVYSDSALTNLVHADTSEADTTSRPGLPQGDSHYFWRVRGGNNYGWGPFSPIFSFRQISSLAPELIYPPADTTIEGSLPVFIWHAGIPGARYQFGLYSDSSLNRVVYIDSSLVDTTLTPSFPGNDSLYFWRVRGGTDSIWGPYSRVSSFRFRSVVPPQLIFPPRDTTIQDSLPIFVWHRATPGTRYLFELYSDSSLSRAVHIDSSLVDTTLTPAFRGNDSLYFWRVKGGANSTWGPYSEVWSFHANLLSQGIDDNLLPQRLSLDHNYPNPFNMETIIMLNVPQGEAGQLQIFDIGGRRIREFRVNGQAHEQRIVWDACDFNGQEVRSGVYFYKLTVGGKSLTDRMVLLK